MLFLVSHIDFFFFFLKNAPFIPASVSYFKQVFYITNTKDSQGSAVCGVIMRNRFVTIQYKFPNPFLITLLYMGFIFGGLRVGTVDMKEYVFICI